MRKQFEPLVIEDVLIDGKQLPTHRQNYYELAYIKSGTGIHQLNESRLPYETGDLFIVSPNDTHHFDISTATTFTFIKFTDHYFSNHKSNRPDSMLALTPDIIMNNPMLKEVKLRMTEPCLTILRNTMDNLVAYNCRKDVAESPLVYYQILSIIGLIKEAVSSLHIRLEGNMPEKEELVFYIHKHVYDPASTQIKTIAKHFNIAHSYFGHYFRRKFGISYRDYLNAYRLSLIESRLQNSSISLKQIADEFGFTDVSHLSNYFKNKFKVSPQQYRV